MQEILSRFFSIHNSETRINNRRKAGKFTNTWKLNNTLLKQPMDQRKDQKKNKKMS